MPVDPLGLRRGSSVTFTSKCQTKPVGHDANCAIAIDCYFRNDSVLLTSRRQGSIKINATHIYLTGKMSLADRAMATDP